MPRTTFGKGISHPGLSDYKYELAEIDEELWEELHPHVWILPIREEDGTHQAFGFFAKQYSLKTMCNDAWENTGIEIRHRSSARHVQPWDLERCVRGLHDPYWNCYMPERNPIFAALALTYTMRQRLEESGRTEFTSDAIHYKDAFGRWTYLYLASATPAPVAYPPEWRF